MKHLASFFLVFCICCSSARSQSLSPTVVASGGNYVSGTTGSISYTIGEPVTTTITGSNNTLTQGFQQPNDIINGLLDIEKEANGSFSVYPVPTTDKLWFGYEFNTEGKVTIELVNALGQKLDYTLSESYQSGKVVHSFDCTPYAAGNYMLSATFTAGGTNRQVLTKKFQIVN
jgi:hypothetical protein